jgi:hypothetical protein
MYVCVYVCMHECICVCVHVCMYVMRLYYDTQSAFQIGSQFIYY